MLCHEDKNAYCKDLLINDNSCFIEQIRLYS